MVSGNKKLFINKTKLAEMLELRRSGYAISSLALIYGCDISSIRHQCDKYKVRPREQVFTLERILSKLIPEVEPTWKLVNGERINLGKNYADYLVMAYPPSKYPYFF